MTVIHEVQQVLTCNTPFGEAQVLFLMDYGIHRNTIWVCASFEDGKIRHFDSNQITITTNHSYNKHIKISMLFFIKINLYWTYYNALYPIGKCVKDYFSYFKKYLCSLIYTKKQFLNRKPSIRSLHRVMLLSIFFYNKILLQLVSVGNHISFKERSAKIIIINTSE